MSCAVEQQTYGTHPDYRRQSGTYTTNWFKYEKESCNIKEGRRMSREKPQTESETRNIQADSYFPISRGLSTPNTTPPNHHLTTITSRPHAAWGERMNL
ncbi:hypothetical protein PAMP_024920 [Pampus punctatissimus]